jgi:diguanylate cyclase (GGDEF)-like protein
VADLKYLVSVYEPNLQIQYDKWSTILESTKTYKKIVYVGLDGNKKAGLEYSAEIDQVLISTESEDFSEQSYFNKTLDLEPGQMCVSKIIITQKEEGNEVSVMFCAPIYSPELSGVLMLVCNTGKIFESLNANMSDTNGKVYLINDFGYWTSDQLEYKSIDSEYYIVSYAMGLLPKDRWELQKDKSHLAGAEGFYTFEESDFQNKLNENRDEPKVFLESSHCIIATLIQKGSPHDYYIYAGLKDKIGKIAAEHYISLIIIFLISSIIAVITSANRAKIEDIRNVSAYDSMTKAYTRHQGLKLLENYLENMSAYEKMCICYIDINGLKEVNDSLGHAIGDELIVTVVSTIKNAIRDHDIIIRMGGDEFIVAFTMVDKASAELIWSRIQKSFKSINAMEDRKYIISVSHGIVEISHAEKNVNLHEVITQADTKMYDEKMRIKKSYRAIRP